MPPPLGLPQRLRGLNQLSSDFPIRLTDALGHRGYADSFSTLRGDDLAWLVEYLDRALDVLPSSSSAFPLCLQKLREVCSRQLAVPQSCMLAGPPPTTTEWPVTSGGYYDIYEESHEGSRVCVRRLRTYSTDEEKITKRAFCREVALWRRLDHRNIVPFIGACADPLQVLSVYMPGGELSQYINAHPDTNRLDLMLCVADGLDYLHSNSVIHGDLKGPSILVDDAGCARLTDFSLSVIVFDREPTEFIKGGHAVRWAAPEILDEKGPVSRQSDIFSLGMVTIEVFTGRAPFYGTAPTTTAVGVLDGKRPPRPFHPDLSDELWEMIEKCWSQEPRYRPDLSQVISCLQALALRPDRVNNDRESDEPLRSGQDRKLSIDFRFRPSRWLPVSYILERLRKFSLLRRSTSDAETGEDARSGLHGNEKSVNRPHQSLCASNIPRREGFWSFRRRIFGRSRRARWGSRIGAPPMHSVESPTSRPGENRSVSFKRSSTPWTKYYVSLRS